MSITYTLSKTTNSSSGSSPLSGSYYQVGTNEQVIDTIVASGSSNVAQAGSFSAPGTSSGDLVAIELVASVNMTLTTNGTSTADVQTITITGTPTGGDFAVVFNGAAAVIPYNAAASAVQTALQALSTIGSGNVTCSGGPLPGTAVVCTFAGTKATGRQSLMTSAGNFTGGTSPAVAVTHTTPGLPQDTISLTAGVPITWDASSIYACPFAAAVTGFYVTSTNAGRLQGRILTY